MHYQQGELTQPALPIFQQQVQLLGSPEAKEHFHAVDVLQADLSIAPKQLKCSDPGYLVTLYG